MTGQKPALNAEMLNEFSTEFLRYFEEQCRLGRPIQNLFNSGSSPEKMRGSGVKPAPDGEDGDADAEIFRYLMQQERSTGYISNFINFSRISNKDEESSRLKSKLRTMRLSERIDKKTQDIKKRNTLLEKDIDQLKNMLALKNTEIDDNIKGIKEKTSMEIGEIIKNINAIKERETEMKSLVDRKIKKIKADEAEAQTKIEKNIEAMKKRLALTKEATDRNIRVMKQREDKEKICFDKKIQQINEEEAKVDRTMKLQQIENEKNIEAKIKNISEIRKNIKKMQNEFALKEEEHKKCIEVMRLYEAKKTNEMEAKLKRMNELKAQTEDNVEKNIQTRQKKLAIDEEELKKSIESLQQYENEKISKIKAKLHRNNQLKALKQNDIEKNFQVMQDTRTKKRQMDDEEYQKSIEVLQQYEAGNAIETVAEVPVMNEAKAEKKDNLEKNIEPQRKRIALNERDASINHISVRNARVLSQQTHTAVTTDQSTRRINSLGSQLAITSVRHRGSRSHRKANVRW